MRILPSSKINSRGAQQRILQFSTSLLLAFSALAVTLSIAFAHAGLTRSEPAANAALTESPPTVTVWFNEAIEPQYGSLAVYNAGGQRVDKFDTQFIPDLEPSLRVSLPPLPTGSYVVTWRVISLGDGHPVGGAFAFGVGVAPDTSAANAANAQANLNTSPDLTASLLRYLSLLAQTVLMGGLVFQVLIWRPARLPLPEAARAVSHRHLSWLADALVGGLVMGVLGALYVQARATGEIFWELFGTRWGVLWIVRAVVTFVAAVLMESLLAAETPRWLGAGLILSGALLLLTTLTSHSAAQGNALRLLADGVHLLAVSVWVGGLVRLTLAFINARGWDAETRARFNSEILPRFSGLAAASVGLILITGVALSLANVPDWAGLMLTAYGQTLLIKVFIAGLAFAFGVYNSLGPRTRTTLSIGLETAVVLGALLGAARLVDLPPATAAAFEDEASALEVTAPVNDMTLSARLRPARLGNNVFDLTFTAAAGNPVRGLPVELWFEPVGGSGLSARVALSESQFGVYSAASAPFTRVGPWTMLVIVTPTQSTAQYVPFQLNIGPDEVVRSADAEWPWPVRAVEWLNRSGPAVLISALGALALGWVWTAWRVTLGARFRWLPWLLSGLLVAALGWVWLILK